MTYETIIVEPGEITEIILNRPERRNAINDPMIEEMFETLDKAERDPKVRVVILRGNGPCFSGGGDMYQASSRRGKSGNQNPASVRDGIKDLALWQNYRKPIIVALHGYVGAQAVRWMLVCDLTVAAQGTRLSYEGLRAGATPGALVTALTLGHKKNKEWQLLAGALTAEEAERHGLINKVVPMEQLYETAREWGRTICSIPPQVILANKHLINQVYEMFGSPTHFWLSNLGNVVSHGNEMDNEFYRLIATKGLKAAMGWRDSQRDSQKLETDGG